VEQLSGTLATEEAEARNTVVEEAALGTEVGEFEERARELDLDVLAADFLARVDTRISTTETANSAFVRLAEEHREETGAARVALDELRARADSLRQEIEGKRLALKEATEQVDQIRREASRSGIDVNITEEQVDADERSLGDEARRVASLISAKRAEQAASKEAVGENAKRARALKTESDGVATSLRTVEQTIARYERELRACGLENESSQSEVAARLEQHVRRTAALEQAKQRVLDFEMALDAAARSAESERLTVRARVAEASLKEAKQHKADEAIWVPYFEGLGARLEETQDRAVAGYTEDYGPLTSTIQRRLRSVSGFEEISLHPEGDRIAVRVARNGEQLPPTDFFSQSQQQILILSLFFTACLTQTWSGFAPILLDDPVTHFDDLNAYAFLDLIGGFLETEPHERQFILSTCDERLFLLARQRFQHLGEQFKSYRFVSCGREGPVVERL